MYTNRLVARNFVGVEGVRAYRGTHLIRPAKNNNQDIANQQAKRVRNMPESEYKSWIFSLHACFHHVSGRVVSTDKNVPDFKVAVSFFELWDLETIMKKAR